MTRPSCNNCLRSKIVCEGYGIKLRWSYPLNYNTKTGNATKVVFESYRDIEDDPSNGTGGQFHQRRQVGFVTWKDPYETYDDMDKDLMILHNSGCDWQVNADGMTKLLGPFGVFRGSNSDSESINTLLQGGGGPNVTSQKFGGGSGVATGPGTGGGVGVGGGGPASGSGDVNRSRTESTESIKRQIDQDGSGESIPKRHHGTNSDSHGTVDAAKATATNSTTNTNNGAHDQPWLSNELREHAMLTAAALNGDSHLLDFIGTFNSQSNTPFYNSNQLLSDLPDTNGSNQMGDFLNLVFHGNNNSGFPNLNTTTSHSIPPHSPTTRPPSQISSSDNHLGPSPAGSQLFYSNYNNYFYNNPYKLNENLEIQLHANNNTSNPHDEARTDIVAGENNSKTQMPTSIMSIVQNPLQPGFNLLVPSPSSVTIPTTALQIEPLTRFLLNYYVTQVADLMTVIPLTENPWKTIYFPRALMAIGELGALGKTSVAKNALLNALLAVSAFNLQSKFPKNSDSMKYYLNLGIRLRNQASLFVKKLLGSGSSAQAGVDRCVANEKYKDILCAVMSMISVDLVWGTMQDTNFYITWCGKVIHTKMITKKKLSTKARILHRIFSSMKLIQDSTCLDIESIKNDYEVINEIGYDVNGDKYVNNPKNKIEFIVSYSKSNSKNTTPLFVNKKLINTKKYDENFATDALYGLPNSLIILFTEIVQLLRTKIYHEQELGTKPANMEQRIKKLHSKLHQWNLDWDLYKGPQENLRDINLSENADDEKVFYSPIHEATYHHIVSFYHALTIYFDRLITNVQPELLQVAVEKTLYHLNSIQKLIAKNEAAIVPLFWQGFIAGCEATTPQLQQSFKKWGADIALYLGSYWGARQIMLEVWRRKGFNDDRSDWVSVIRDWEMNLMLN
ncbi:uncharacterized protein KQ657_004174 [Scheffersomyces spartinae]|uniref:Arginine metabolism regulation protein II n=1 Tax=Scheffersomyces spartinae TaxID=45513 RepID=A0A9P8AJQ4_9ASCO|nr:uncharacterized protein KQ657_004174 [Scheffersomyces spartinae]KAG7195060.1 hypothetical protein KQ657_004174 [Scheffersomyces spartinae]